MSVSFREMVSVTRSGCVKLKAGRKDWQEVSGVDGVGFANNGTQPPRPQQHSKSI